MNMQTILNQYSGNKAAQPTTGQGIGDKLGQLGNRMPGGLAGGAVAGGVMALILSNKSARKFAGTAATFGGAALLGGLAYKAYQNWQQGKQDATPVHEDSFSSAEILSPDYQLTLIKAMIAAARADGHIDANEQQHIFEAVDKMALTTAEKALVLDLLHQPIKIDELVQGATTLEQKSELYLVSCLIADPDQHVEKVYLAQLAGRLDLPPELAQQLQDQARQTMAAT